MPPKLTNKPKPFAAGTLPDTTATDGGKKTVKDFFKRTPKASTTRQQFDGLNTRQAAYTHSVSNQALQLLNTKRLNAPAAVIYNNGTWDKVSSRICEDVVREQTDHQASNVSIPAMARMHALEYERKHRNGNPGIPASLRLLPQTGNTPPTDNDYREATVMAFLDAMGEKDPQRVLNSFKMAGLGGLHRQHVTGAVVASTALSAATLLAPDPTFVTQVALTSTRQALQLVIVERNHNSGVLRARNAGSEERMVMARADATPSAKVGRSVMGASGSVMWELNRIEHALRQQEALLIQLQTAQVNFQANPTEPNRQAVADADKALNFHYAKSCHKAEVKETYKVANDSSKIEYFGNWRYLTASYAGSGTVLAATGIAVASPLLVNPVTGPIIAGSLIAGAGGVLLGAYVAYQLSEGPAKDGEQKAKRAIMAWAKATDSFTGSKPHGQKARAEAHRKYVVDLKAARSEKGTATEWGIRKADSALLQSLSSVSSQVIEDSQARQNNHAEALRQMAEAKTLLGSDKHVRRRQAEGQLSTQIQTIAANDNSPAVLASIAEYRQAADDYEQAMVKADGKRGLAGIQEQADATGTFAQDLRAWANTAPPALKASADARAQAYTTYHQALHAAHLTTGAILQKRLHDAENQLLTDLENLSGTEAADYVGVNPEVRDAHAGHLQAMQRAQTLKGAAKATALEQANANLLSALHPPPPPLPAAAGTTPAPPPALAFNVLAGQDPGAAYLRAHEDYRAAVRTARGLAGTARDTALDTAENGLTQALQDLALHAPAEARDFTQAIADARNTHRQAVQGAATLVGSARDAATGEVEASHLKTLHTIVAGDPEAVNGSVNESPVDMRNWAAVRKLGTDLATVAGDPVAETSLKNDFSAQHKENFNAKAAMDGWKGNLRMGMDNATRIANGSVAKTQKKLRDAVKGEASQFKLRTNASLATRRRDLEARMEQDVLDMLNLDLARRRMAPLPGQSSPASSEIQAASLALAEVSSQPIQDLFTDEGRKQVEATLKAKELTAGEVERYTYANAGATALGIATSTALIGSSVGISGQRVVDAGIKQQDPTHVGQFDNLKFNDQNLVGAFTGAAPLNGHQSAHERAYLQQHGLKEAREKIAKPKDEPAVVPSITLSGHQACLRASDPEVKTQIAALVRQLATLDQVPEAIELIVKPTATGMPSGKFKIDLRPTTAYQKSRYEHSPTSKKVSNTLKHAAILGKQVGMSLAGLPTQGIAQAWLRGSREPLKATLRKGPETRETLFNSAQALSTAATAPPVPTQAEVDRLKRELALEKAQLEQESQAAEEELRLARDASTNLRTQLQDQREWAQALGQFVQEQRKAKEASESKAEETIELKDTGIAAQSEKTDPMKKAAPSLTSPERSDSSMPKKPPSSRSRLFKGKEKEAASPTDAGTKGASWFGRKAKPSVAPPSLLLSMDESPAFTKGDVSFFSGSRAAADQAEAKRQFALARLAETRLKLKASPQPAATTDPEARFALLTPPSVDVAGILRTAMADVPVATTTETSDERAVRNVMRNAAFTTASERVIDALDATDTSLMEEVRRNTPPLEGIQQAGRAHDIATRLGMRAARNITGLMADPNAAATMTASVIGSSSTGTAPADPLNTTVASSSQNLTTALQITPQPDFEARAPHPLGRMGTQQLMPHLRNQLFQYGVTAAPNDGGVLRNDQGDVVSEGNPMNCFIVSLIMLASGKPEQTQEMSRHAEHIRTEILGWPANEMLGANENTIELVNLINTLYRENLPPLNVTLVGPRMDDSLQVGPIQETINNAPDGNSIQVSILQDAGHYEALFMADPAPLGLNFRPPPAE
jgi:hypothetical protein